MRSPVIAVWVISAVITLSGCLNPPIAIGGACSTDEDCESGACRSGVCVDPLTATDSGTDTDAGSGCGACGPNETCHDVACVDSSCIGVACPPNHVCVAGACLSTQ